MQRQNTEHWSEWKVKGCIIVRSNGGTTRNPVSEEAGQENQRGNLETQGETLSDKQEPRQGELNS